MKKGLLSILAGALLVVGCQNYDDQFDNLESQINALASTVAGLSQVQSDIASLAGTVSSLSSTVNGLGSQIDTAVANGLADIQSDIDAIEAAVADVASSDEVSALSEAVAASQEDLDELLANSSVFQGNVIVNNTATLETFHAMKSSLAIVNGYVDIDATTDMDATKLQELVDAIQVTTKQFDYQAGSSAVAAVTFNNLSGTQTLTIKQAGDYLFQGLGSATVINLKDDYKSKVTKIDFRALTSVTKFQTSGTDNTISFSKAMELHLTSLAYYAPLSLTIVTDEGAAMPFIMDDVDADGDQSNITLNITGPASFTATNLTDGSLTFTDVATVDVDGFEGAFTINSGVETFTADSVTALTLGSSLDLETIDITGVADPDVTTDTNGPSGLTFSGIASLESITIAGKTEGISVQNCGNVTDITISADVDGAINIGGTTGNSDLTTVTLTGSKATGVNVSNNADLTTLSIDTTFRGAGTSTTVDGDIDVVGNASLESLTVASTAVENLTVTGNDALTTVDFSAIATDGTTGTPDVDIYDNDLSGTLTDTEDTASTLTSAGQANDLGSVASDSGLKTIKDYLTHIDGATGANIVIAFDTVDFTTEADATSEVTYTTDATASAEYASKTELFIAYITPNTADTGSDAVASKRSYIITDYGTAGDTISLYANGVLLGTPSVANSESAAGAGLNIDNILSTSILAAADSAGITLSASDGASAWVEITFSTNDSADENSTTKTPAASFGTHVSDSFTIGIAGSNSAVVTGLGDGTTTASLTNALANAWLAANSTSALRKWAVDSTTNTAKLRFTALDSGSSQINSAIVFSASIASWTNSNVGYLIGNDVNYTNSTADNKAVGHGIIVTMTADTAGRALSEIGSPTQQNATTTAGNASVTASGVTIVELTSTLDRSVTESNVVDADSVYATESRSDVVIPQDSIAAATSTAETFNRVGWL
jgi:hypothetical protein